MGKHTRKNRKKQGTQANEQLAPVAIASGVTPAHEDKISKTQKRKLQKKRATAAAATAAASAAAARKAVSNSGDSTGALEVLHEDVHALVISKPQGMLCHPSPGFWDHGTVVHALGKRSRLAGFSVIPEEMMQPRQGYTGEADSVIPRAIVHRLDRGTTGLMVIAKTPLAEAHFAQAFKLRTTRKRYVAVLSGRPNGGIGAVVEEGGALIRVSAPIDRDPARPGKMLVAPSGKAAQSVVHVHAWSAASRVSLVSVDLLTGRQHQIRVHCAHLGAPLANDEAYSTPDEVRKLRASLGPLPRNRPLLHAWSMEVAHPDQACGTPLSVRAPLPADMESVIGRLWPNLGMNPAAWPQLNLGEDALGPER